MALAQNEIRWLKDNYPTLSVKESGTKITGELTIDASYDSDSKVFHVFEKEYPGIRLKGTFKIQISDTSVETSPRRTIPSLTLTETDFICNIHRHFFGGNKACLCGPSEVTNFIQNGYSLPRYIAELVIPFLYAQIFFTSNKIWPWPAYSHNSLGALESYCKSGSIHERDTMVATIMMLTANTGEWPKIKFLLNRKRKPRQSIECLCGSKKSMALCHSTAFEGLEKLHADLRKLKIKIR